MKRIALLTFLFLLTTIAAFGQAVRVDQFQQTYGPNVPSSGGPLPQTLWVANATALVCAHPSSTYADCQANPVTTYTDSTESTPCPPSTPLVLLPGNTCTASTGVAADVGFWYQGGLVDYWVVTPYGTYGPYTLNSKDTGGSLPTGCVPSPVGNITCSGTVSANKLTDSTNLQIAAASPSLPTAVYDMRGSGTVSAPDITGNGNNCVFGGTQNPTLGNGYLEIIQANNSYCNTGIPMSQTGTIVMKVNSIVQNSAWQALWASSLGTCNGLASPVVTVPTNATPIMSGIFTSNNANANSEAFAPLAAGAGGDTTLVYSRSATADQLYINGVLSAWTNGAPATGGSAASAAGCVNGTLYLGGEGSSNSINGFISYAAVYPTALTATQALAVSAAANASDKAKDYVPAIQNTSYTANLFGGIDSRTYGSYAGSGGTYGTPWLNDLSTTNTFTVYNMSEPGQTMYSNAERIARWCTLYSANAQSNSAVLYGVWNDIAQGETLTNAENFTSQAINGLTACGIKVWVATETSSNLTNWSTISSGTPIQYAYSQWVSSYAKAFGATDVIALDESPIMGCAACWNNSTYFYPQSPYTVHPTNAGQVVIGGLVSAVLNYDFSAYSLAYPHLQAGSYSMTTSDVALQSNGAAAGNVITLPSCDALTGTYHPFYVTNANTASYSISLTTPAGESLLPNVPSIVSGQTAILVPVGILNTTTRGCNWQRADAGAGSSIAVGGDLSGTTSAATVIGLGGTAFTASGSGTSQAITLAGSFFAPVLGQVGVFYVDGFPGNQTAGACTQTGNAISAANTWGAANLRNPTIVFGVGSYCSFNQLTMPVNSSHWTWDLEGQNTGYYVSTGGGTIITETGTPSTAVLLHPDTGSVGNGLDTFFIHGITINANYKAPCMQLGDAIFVDINDFTCLKPKGAFGVAYADPAATGIGNGTGGTSALTVQNSFVVGDNSYNYIPPVVSCPYAGGFVNGTACTVTSGGQFDSSQNNNNGIMSYVYGRQQGGVANPCTPACTVTFTTSSLGGSLSTIATVTESVTASNALPVQVLFAPNPNATIGQYAPGYAHDSTFIDVKANGVFQTGIEDLGAGVWFRPDAWSYQQVAISASGSTMYSPVADTAQRIGIFTTNGTFYGATYAFAASPPSGYTDFFVGSSTAVITYFGDFCTGNVVPSSSYYFHFGYTNDYYGWDNPQPSQLVLPTPTPHIHGGHNCENQATPELEIDGVNPTFTPSLNLYSTQTSVTGTTAGHAVWSEPEQGLSRKSALVYLNGYENTTATAQTITLPTSFATVGYVATDGGSCTGVTVSGATVTLPSSMGGTQTGLCKIEGY